MKFPKLIDKAAIATGFKEAPRRRGLGKKNPARMAQDQKSLAVVAGVSPALRRGAAGTAASTVQTLRVVAGDTQVRNYKEVSATDGINSDWALSAISQDSDVWQNNPALRQRSRHLFDTDVYFQKYTEELYANVPGWNGYNFRLLIKETEDRIVYSAKEMAFLYGHQRRWDRVYDYLERRHGKDKVRRRMFVQHNLNTRQSGSDRDETLASERSSDTSRTASVQVGDFDLFAIKVLKDAWEEWQQAQYCTVTRTLEYNETRQARILAAARDGGFFIRHILDPSINKFGYSQQLINDEWCDYNLNVAKLDNGNEIRMGIELDGKWKFPVAYWFIKRQPMDWQFSVPGMFNYTQTKSHERILASEITHYTRRRYADSTRPAPWSASVIPKSRHLDKYEEAEVIAARVAACKMGFFYSDIDPSGGTGAGEQPDPTKAATLESEPGSFQGLSWGTKFQSWDPNHPNGNFDLFRKGLLRAWCAGLPGANYNIIANDLQGVNYSSGRLGMLDERELWKLLQDFDIKKAETPTFQNFLYMALLTGVPDANGTPTIRLPLAKIDKYNKPKFRGRRWAWVDPMSEVQANALAIANKLTSRTRVVEDSDSEEDFETILFQLAEEEMMLSDFGMDAFAVVTGKPAVPAKPAPDNTDSGDVSNATAAGDPNQN